MTPAKAVFGMTRPCLLVLLAVVSVTLAGCNRFGYDAHIDSFQSSSGSAYLRASGWLRDVVHQSRPASQSVVRWQIDGQLGLQTPISAADFGTRPDVDAALGPSSAAINSAVVAQGLARGTYQVCVDVVPADSVHAPFVALDCEEAVVRYDQFDHSALDSVGVSGATVTASGWYKRTIGTLSQTQNQPWFAIDGVAVASPAVVSPVNRPDAVAVHGDAVRGIALSAPITTGQHTVCIGLTGPFAGPGVTGTTTCRSFTVA